MKKKIINISIFFLLILVVPHDNSVATPENYSVNEGERVPAANDVEDLVGYLIITIEPLRGALDPLAVWKMQKGLNPVIKTITEIYFEYPGRDIQEKIKNCIIDYYENANVQWVLLAGDNAEVPSRDAYVDDGYIELGDDGETVSCDFYYCDLNNDWDSNNDALWGTPEDDHDFEPEIYVGRLTASFYDDMEHLVTRLVNYEKNPPVGSWMQNALYAGAMGYFDEDWNNDGLIDYSRADPNRNHNFLNDRLPEDWTSLIMGEAEGIQPTDYYYDLPITKTNLEVALNEGSSIGSIVGHGWAQGMVRSVFEYDMDGDGLYDIWDDYSYSYELIDTYSATLDATNEQLGMYFLGGCSCGTFDHYYESIQEYFLRTTAIGCIAGSHLVWGEDQWTERDHGGWYSDGLNSRFWEQLFINNQPGKAFALAKADYMADRDEFGVVEPFYYPVWEHKTLLQFNLLGDPEVPIWLGIPDQLNYEAISTSTDSLVFSVTNGDVSIAGATVTVYSEGEIVWIGTSDEDGMVEISGFELTPDMVLTIIKINFMPFQASISLDSAPFRYRYRHRIRQFEDLPLMSLSM